MNGDIEIETKINVTDLLKELEKLGISRYIIEQKHVRNLYMAKTIVEGYHFGRELSQEEKKALIQAIAGNAQLDRRVHRYIFTIIHNFEQIGLDEQEIYGTIINLGVNGTVVEGIGKGYSYGELLANSNNACQTISQYKDSMKKRVTPMTILTAISNNMNEQEEQKLEQELEEIGISKKFIKQKYSSNLYIAKRIVEAYDFGRDLTQEEKKALIQAVVASSILTKRKRSLATLMQRFEQMGLNEQEIYGTIINLGVNGTVVEVARCGYAELLLNSNNACGTIANHIGEIQTEVTEETIEKSLSKAEKIMRKSVKHQKDRNTISTQTSTRAQLASLIKQEQLQGIGIASNSR